MTPPGKAKSTRDLDRALRELTTAGQACANLELQIEDARETRDHAIRRASDLGVSRRAVAGLAQVTVGRVQQILDYVPRPEPMSRRRRT